MFNLYVMPFFSYVFSLSINSRLLILQTNFHFFLSLTLKGIHYPALNCVRIVGTQIYRKSNMDNQSKSVGQVFAQTSLYLVEKLMQKMAGEILELGTNILR